MGAPDKSKKVPFWVSFLSGGISGTVGAVITCPLEVVKTRLQSKQFYTAATPSPATLGPNGINPLHFRQILWTPVRQVGNTLEVVRTVARQEGLGALWKGIGATVVGVMPARAIYFSTYTKGKHLLAELANGGNENSPFVHLGAAALAGVSTSTLTNPIWLVKTRMQLQSSSNRLYHSSWHCLKTIVKQEGLRSLYKGLGASYLGVVESTMQWVIYEHLKGRLQSHEKRQPAWVDFFGAAATAKFIAAVLAYPHEVLRTRMREETNNATRRYRSLGQTVRLIMREEGFRGFYGGMTAHLLRVVPNSAIMFFCYEFLLHAYAKLP